MNYKDYAVIPSTSYFTPANTFPVSFDGYNFYTHTPSGTQQIDLRTEFINQQYNLNEEQFLKLLEMLKDWEMNKYPERFL